MRHPRRIIVACVASTLIAAPASNAASADTADRREVVSFGTAAREELRAGMRGYLESVQGIVDGLSTSRPAEVAASAARSGERMLTLESAITGLALPPGFVTLSLDTHRKFDALAAMAATGAPRLQLLGALDEILSNCTSCHAAYRLGP